MHASECQHLLHYTHLQLLLGGFIKPFVSVENVMSSKSLASQKKDYEYTVFQSLGHALMNFIQGHNGGAVGSIVTSQLHSPRLHPELGLLLRFACLCEFPLDPQ